MGDDATLRRFTWLHGGTLMSACIVSSLSEGASTWATLLGCFIFGVAFTIFMEMWVAHDRKLRDNCTKDSAGQ